MILLAETANQAYLFAGIAAACITVGAAVVGIFFRGAAAAWKDERDAAVDKADRLEETVKAQAGQIATLQTQVAELKARNVDQVAAKVDRLADHMVEEHKAILEAFQALSSDVKGNTTALEFLFKQVFPTAVVPVEPAPAD